MRNIGIEASPRLVLSDKRKVLWFVVDGKGCFRYRSGDKKAGALLFSNKGLPTVNVSDIVECSEGILLVYSTGLVVCVDRDNLRVKWKLSDIEKQRAINETFSLFVDRDNNLWVYGSPGMWVYDLSTRKLDTRWYGEIDIRSYNILHTIAQDKYGHIWFGKDHVSATPESRFSTNSSLIVVPQSVPITFSLEEKGDTVVLKTAKLEAKVSTVTGEVVFADSTGRLILSEDKGGRSFQPIAVDNTKGYSVRQIFQSPNDEAFYGLGQHQADEFNYKGKNEELFQYNTKVSVPFIVSNKNYGILWDSYSLCRFGDQRGYSQLQRVFKLYDKEGRSGGLTGTYIPGNKSNKVIVRNEDSLYFEDLNTIKNLPADFRLGGSKVTYEGEIEPSETGIFKLILYYAGYTKVYIDNQLVVPERWRTA